MPAFVGTTIASMTKEYQLGLSRLELIGVVLDDGVGEKLLAHALNLGAGASGIALLHLDLDIFALAHIANRAEAKRILGTSARTHSAIAEAIMAGDVAAASAAARAHLDDVEARMIQPPHKVAG